MTAATGRPAAGRTDGRLGSPAPPSCNTGAIDTSLSVHWLRGIARMPVLDVVGYVAGLLGESVEVVGSGRHGYSTTYLIGPVKVWASEDRADCCVEVTGSACEALGLERLAVLYFGLGLRVSRLDLAVDGCPFTPHELRDRWLRDGVRSAARFPNVAALAKKGWMVKPGFEGVRTHKWDESPTGATLRMGSGQSTHFARCYDARGSTRFELVLQHRRSAAAAPQVFGAVEDAERFGSVVLGLVRDFVDFVEVAGDSNRARAPLTPFWDAFCGAVARARLTLEGIAQRTIEDALAWFEHQVAPIYALLRQALPSSALDRVASDGRRRWRRRHVAMLGSGPALPVTA